MKCSTCFRMLARTTGALAAGLVVNAAPAAEPAYPTRTIRLVVPFAPGGALDAVGRILAPKLGESMGQTWVVDNRSGAGGNVGSEIVARANPDGYTVLVALSQQLTANPSLYNLPFNIKDLEPVAMVAIAEHMLVVHPSVPATTVQEFVAVAKQKPGALNYASSGIGSPVHLGAELLKKRAGIDMVHVAYKGGGPAAAALLSGEAKAMVGSVASTIALVKAGRLRAIATTGPKQSKLLPNVPTIAASGYPGFDVTVWFAFVVPAATPKHVVERLRAESNKAIQQPDVQTAMTRQGLEPETSTPAELAARVKTESAMWAAIIRELGIKAE